MGGLTVVKSLLRANLFERIIYFGDTARVPYGTKDPKTIQKYSLQALDFFDDFNIDMMIVACNSASAHGLDALQKKASFPVVGVIKAGLLSLTNLNLNLNDEILIIGTTATINSKIYQKSLQNMGFTNITAIATPLFVPIVEEEIKGAILNETIKHYLGKTKTPKAMILACTHFPLIAKELESFFPSTKIISSADAIVEYLENENLPIKKAKPSLELYASDSVKDLEKKAKIWLKKD